MQVIHNNTCPESTLKKKKNYICYHVMCESAARDDTLTGDILITRFVLKYPPSYYMLGNESSRYQTCHMTYQMIFENLGSNLRPTQCW